MSPSCSSHFTSSSFNVTASSALEAVHVVSCLAAEVLRRLLLLLLLMLLLVHAEALCLAHVNAADHAAHIRVAGWRVSPQLVFAEIVVEFAAAGCVE